MRNGLAKGWVWYPPYYEPSPTLIESWNHGLAEGAGIVAALVLGLIFITLAGAIFP